MTRTGFAVTFDRIFPCNENEYPETESGFVLEGATLREAIEAAGGLSASYEPSSSWVEDAWFTNYRYNEGTHEYYTAGIEENRSIHIKDGVTPASRRRIAKLLGVRVR